MESLELFLKENWKTLLLLCQEMKIANKEKKLNHFVFLNNQKITKSILAKSKIG
jgi:hypothetical protein